MLLTPKVNPFIVFHLYLSLIRLYLFAYTVYNILHNPISSQPFNCKQVKILSLQAFNVVA